MDNLKSEKNNSEDNRFKEELLQLIGITSRLKKTGLIILICLISSIVLLAAYSILNRQLKRDYHTFSTAADLLLWMYIVLTIICGIFMLFRFNNLRNKGMIIYEELTDEIDWSSKRKQFLRRPPIKTRIIIKDFLKTSDLPFTSGTNGQAFYFVLFFIVIIAAILVKALV